MSASIPICPARRVSVLLGGTGRSASLRCVSAGVAALLRPRPFSTPEFATSVAEDGHD